MGPDGLPTQDPATGQTPTVYYTKPAPQEFIQILPKGTTLVDLQLAQIPIALPTGVIDAQLDPITGMYNIVNGVFPVIPQAVQPGQFITYTDGNNDGVIEM